MTTFLIFSFAMFFLIFIVFLHLIINFLLKTYLANNRASHWAGMTKAIKLKLSGERYTDFCNL